ncbi:hypothetical protein B0T14DRAFT_517752 [Immersiella caudata]|uniref:Thioredoxin domain-containing protein n=1 Tax=Immersiella caudata TaxID=314043 RepID=A0AA40C4B1_9PEZI|nr:hypothetical protein B0T14DRAFT_517752 [Immersiella caudata]
MSLSPRASQTDPSSPQTPALELEWTALQSKDPSHITSIDCSLSDFAKLCSSLDVHSFPTIRLYHPDGSNNKPNRFTRYRGPRRTTPILSFLRRTLRPPLQTVTPFNTTSFLSSDSILFIAHFPPTNPSSKTLLQKYSNLAKKYRDRYSFAIHSNVQGVGVGEEEKAKVECFNIPDELQRSITEGLDSEKVLEEFVRVCGGSLIPELTRRNEIGFYQSGKSLVHYFVRNDKERTEYVQEILPLAKKYGEYLHFTTTDINEYPDAVEMMGLKRGLRGLSVQTPSTGDVYPYTGKEELTAHVVEMFLSDIIQGKVKPWQRPRRTEHEEL